MAINTQEVEVDQTTSASEASPSQCVNLDHTHPLSPPPPPFPPPPTPAHPHTPSLSPTLEAMDVYFVQHSSSQHS